MLDAILLPTHFYCGKVRREMWWCETGYFLCYYIFQCFDENIIYNTQTHCACSHLREIKWAAAWKFYFDIKMCVLCTCVWVFAGVHISSFGQIAKLKVWNSEWMEWLVWFSMQKNALGHLCRQLHTFYLLCTVSSHYVHWPFTAALN